MPIRYAARRLGTINLCGEEGMYSARRGSHPRKMLAGLMVPALISSGD